MLNPNIRVLATCLGALSVLITAALFFHLHVSSGFGPAAQEQQWFVASSNERLSFDDEFDGMSLDISRWVVLNRGGDASNNEQQCYLPKNAFVSGGLLAISAQWDTPSCGSIGASYNYSSAMIQWRSFNFLYGRIEMRARMPGGQGPWPAIWLLGSDCQQTNPTAADNVGRCNWPNPGSDEIDIAEFLNSSYTTVNQQIHSADGNPGCKPGLSDASQNWHTYSMDWTPGRLVFQIDGAPSCTLTSAVPSTPMFLVINTAIGGAGGPVNNTTLPVTLLIDYVRVSPSS